MAIEHRYDVERGLDEVRGPGFRATFRRRGAEIIGLWWTHPRHGEVPVLWRSGEADPPASGWKNHATVLFPVVGALHGKRSRTADGVQVAFPGQHGLARHFVFPLVDTAIGDGQVRLAYRLEADAATRAMYPWDFSLTVAYVVGPARLENAIEVEARDPRPMPFQAGWHPGFNTPLRAGAGAKAACRLHLPEGRVWRLGNDPDCFLTGERTLTGGGDVAFSEAELDGTCMFDLSEVPPAGRVVTLADPDGGLGVRVSLPDHPHLGIWSDAGAPFLCIEPWQGMDDRVVQEPFDEKFGIVRLPPRAVDRRRVVVEGLGW
jgi:galactose mutarotase-like enzyme